MNNYYTTLLKRLRTETLVRKTVIHGKGIGDEAIFSQNQMVASLAKKSHTWDEQDLLIERLDSKIELVLCGGGHVAKELYGAALALDMEVSILDDREEFCNKQLYAEAELYCAPFEKTLREEQQWIKPFFVIITRGHSFDQDCLEMTLGLPHSYIGMIGSRHKVAITMENLKEKGIKAELLEEVYSPIGLAIGAVTASEIAISILAQIISIYRKETNSVRLDPKLLRSLGKEKGYILVRVIKKKGSAPCDVGFQLAVFKDGSTQGTVGGGLVEAKAIAHARTMLSDKALANQVIEYNLDNKQALSIGMICGGEIALLFQRQ